MVKREKILIGVSLVAVIFLIVYTFTGQEKKVSVVQDDTKSLSLMENFVAEQLIVLKKFEQREVDEVIIKKAGINWYNDPFADPELLRQIQGYAKKEKSLMEINKGKHGPLLYSGYIQIGKKLLAIVNGMEYEKGDTIEGTLYEVFSVSTATESIMLRSPDSTITTVFISDDAGTEQNRRDKNI